MDNITLSRSFTADIPQQFIAAATAFPFIKFAIASQCAFVVKAFSRCAFEEVWSKFGEFCLCPSQNALSDLKRFCSVGIIGHGLIGKAIAETLTRQGMISPKLTHLHSLFLFCLSISFQACQAQ